MANRETYMKVITMLQDLTLDWRAWAKDAGTLSYKMLTTCAVELDKRIAEIDKLLFENEPSPAAKLQARLGGYPIYEKEETK